MVFADDTEKANIFNDYFGSQANVDNSNVILPNINYNHNCRISDTVLSREEIKDIVFNLDCSKAVGPDLINARLLKEASET